MMSQEGKKPRGRGRVLSRTAPANFLPSVQLTESSSN